jgi:type II secretory pathway pseudopilin PulG
MELLIVIALIGIVTAIASANFKNYRDRTNMREAARKISSDIQLYKQRAVAESKSYRIVFSAEDNNYVIQRETAVANVFEDLNTKTVCDGGKVPVSIDGTPGFGGDATLSLNPRGTTEPGSLILKHASPKVKRMRITTSIMGRVTVNYI